MISSTLRKILQASREHSASDIHLVAGLAPAIRVNGDIFMAKSDAISSEKLSRIVNETLNDEQKKQLKKELQICFSLSDDEFGRFRISVYHRGGGPELAIRMCSQDIKTRDELALPQELDGLLNKTAGLILITGPTGVGKTTTMSYMIDQINCDRRCKIVTIEDPVEYVHHHKNAIVIQQEVHTDVISFSKALVHVLRQDPDVIAIGEMRDLETISTALTAAETGHLVIATLHTPNVSQTVERVISVFPPGHQSQIMVQLADSLQGVISQQLIQTVDKSRRVLAYELLICNGAVRNVIRNNECYKLRNILTTSSSVGMRSMDMSLAELYEQGLISYEAMLSRATHPEDMRKKYNPASV